MLFSLIAVTPTTAKETMKFRTVLMLKTIMREKLTLTVVISIGNSGVTNKSEQREQKHKKSTCGT